MLDRIPLPVALWAASAVAGLIDDWITYRKDKSTDQSVRWSWLPFVRRTVLIPLGIGGGAAGLEGLL